MSPDAAIREILGVDPGVGLLVPLASIYCGADLPEGHALPAILCMLNTNSPEMGLGGPAGLNQAVVEIQAHAIDQAGKSGLALAKAIGAAVDNALNGYKGVFGDKVAQGVFTVGPTDLEPDREALIYGTSVTATAWFR